jgi:hypothetical protein
LVLQKEQMQQQHFQTCTVSELRCATRAHAAAAADAEKEQQQAADCSAATVAATTHPKHI